MFREVEFQVGRQPIATCGARPQRPLVLFMLSELLGNFLLSCRGLDDILRVAPKGPEKEADKLLRVIPALRGDLEEARLS